MRNTFIIGFISLFFLGCTKDKFTSAPQLKVKKVNTNTLYPGQSLEITLSFTDAEGDLKDSIYIGQVKDATCASAAGEDCRANSKPS